MRASPVPSQCCSGLSGVIRRLTPAAVVASLAGACASAPAPTTYDLTAPPARNLGRINAQVSVAQPAATQALAGQQIIVKDASGTITTLGNAQWADELPDLLQSRLIHTFENASLIGAVTRPSSGAVADVQLVTEIRAFEVQTPENQAVVQITAKLVSDRTGRIIKGRIFTSRVPVASVDAPSAARALDEALSAAMLDIVRWVSSTSLPSRDEPLEDGPRGDGAA